MTSPAGSAATTAPGATMISLPEGLAAIPHPLFLIDDEGRIREANRAARDLIPDWRSDDPRPFHAVLPALTAGLVEDDDVTTQPSQSFRWEIQIDTPGGEARDYLASYEPLPASDDAPAAAWVLLLTDITYVRRAERSSRDSLAVEKLLSGVSSRFLGVGDVGSAIRASLGDLGRFTDASLAFLLVLDSTASRFAAAHEWHAEEHPDMLASLVGQPRDALTWWARRYGWSEMIDVPDLSTLPDAALADLQGLGAPTRGALLILPLNVDGLAAGAIGVHHEQPRGDHELNDLVALDIFRHIVERVIQLDRRDEALQESLVELHHKQNQLIQSEKMASLGQMAAGIAHELNNPISFVMSNLTTLQEYSGTIRTALQQLRTSAAGDVDREDLEFMLEDLDPLLDESVDGCRRVRDIVLNLKGFARTDEHTPSEVDINDCVRSTLKIVWNELKYRCQVVEDLGELPLLRCYPGKINQVIMNLLVNAAHAIETEGTITIRTRATADEVVLEVADTGSGIAPHDLTRLFEPFFTTKPPGKGTGLGLYICHGIAESHGGRLEATSEPGQGSRFRLHLPLTGIPEGDDA